MLMLGIILAIPDQQHAISPHPAHVAVHNIEFILLSAINLSPDMNRHARGIVELLATLLFTLSFGLAQQAGPLPDAPSAVGGSTQAQSGRRHRLEIVARRSVIFPDLAATSGPLGPVQKFKLFVTNSASPHILAGSAASAGISQAADSNTGYGQGGEAYGKRFGAAVARNATSNFFGTFLLPSLLRQDPRFFVKEAKGFRENATYAVSRVLLTRTDDGREALNWGGLVGPLASEGIANSYLPSEERTAGRTFRRYGLDLAFRAGGNMLRQYWPTFFKHLRPTRVAGIPQAEHRDAARANSSAPTGAEFGGTYDKLTKTQQDLVKVWVEQYNRRTGKHLKPEDAYNEASISPRATFEAVTNALASTKLSGHDGESLGTVLDLVEAIRTVRGKVPRAKSDLQFRVFATTKPQTIDVLQASREFTRKGDNTVFHHGYPVNYRQKGGEPSIQVSLSRDGRQADIDVDYRSSGFPAALFNGHLTADNSDVRAGGNYSEHARRWQGLANWWSNLFGLPVEHDSGFVAEPERDIAKNPRVTAASNVEDAVSDFLATWLVQKKPNLALAYFSPQAFACFTDTHHGESQTANTNPTRDPVPHTLWVEMEETNFLLGNPATLSDAVAPVPLADRGLKVLSHEHAAEFTLARVPGKVATELACAASSSASKDPAKDGTSYAAAFRIRVPGEDDAPVLLLWRKEQGYWKIASVQADPNAAGESPLPDATQVVTTSRNGTVNIHPQGDLLRQIQSFFDALFLQRNPDVAFQYFAPSAFACVNSALEPQQKPTTDMQAAKEYLLQDLREIAQRAPSGRQLTEIIEAYDPGDAALGTIAHSRQQAYVLASVPAEEVAGLACETAPANSDPNPSALPDPGGDSTFATFFQVIEPGNEAAPIGLLWKRQNDQWKIAGYRIDEP